MQRTWTAHSCSPYVSCFSCGRVIKPFFTSLCQRSCGWNLDLLWNLIIIKYQWHSTECTLFSLWIKQSIWASVCRGRVRTLDYTPSLPRMISDDVRWQMLRMEKIWRSSKADIIKNGQCETVTPVSTADNSIISIMASQQDSQRQSLVTVQLCQGWMRLCFWPLSHLQAALN